MAYLDEQLITYLGNKRKLLSLIDNAINNINGEIKIAIDIFSGSGVVSRLFKEKNFTIIANDLEGYSKTINECYLSNQKDFDIKKYNEIKEKILSYPQVTDGIISRLYAPKNTNDIKIDERAFYTKENAILIDTYRTAIEKICPQDYKKYFIAPLLSEASIHTNTSGVFKGFYKNTQGIGHFGGIGENALERIMGTIELKEPVFSSKNTDYKVYQEDANILVKNISGDLAYLDPPYNQHPYGSNYHMLNTINDYIEPNNISKVAGIPSNWNRSAYNQRLAVGKALEQLIQDLQVKYILLSYNNEGFLTQEEIINILEKYGKVSTFIEQYNAFRGSRNLQNRDLHVNEYLFLLEK